jgi:hypothetical protein
MKTVEQTFLLCLMTCCFSFIAGLMIGLKEAHLECPEVQVIQEGMIQVDSVTWQKVEIRRTNVKRHYAIQEK